MLESKFQRELIKDIKILFDGCVVLKNDPSYIQGIPDLIVLFEDRWAALECKRSSTSPTQTNQKYYVKQLNGMSFASFISPDNKDEVLDALQLAFRTHR